jgi:hypothetical protein
VLERFHRTAAAFQVNTHSLLNSRHLFLKPQVFIVVFIVQIYLVVA